MEAYTLTEKGMHLRGVRLAQVAKTVLAAEPPADTTAALRWIGEAFFLVRPGGVLFFEGTVFRLVFPGIHKDK